MVILGKVILSVFFPLTYIAIQPGHASANWNMSEHLVIVTRFLRYEKKACPALVALVCLQGPCGVFSLCSGRPSHKILHGGELISHPCRDSIWRLELSFVPAASCSPPATICLHFTAPYIMALGGVAGLNINHGFVIKPWIAIDTCSNDKWVWRQVVYVYAELHWLQLCFFTGVYRARQQTTDYKQRTCTVNEYRDMSYSLVVVKDWWLPANAASLSLSVSFELHTSSLSKLVHRGNQSRLSNQGHLDVCYNEPCCLLQRVWLSHCT